jgi:hypothetical protein
MLHLVVPEIGRDHLWILAHPEHVTFEDNRATIKHNNFVD